MSKRPKKKTPSRSTRPVADRFRDMERKALRRSLKVEREIQWLVRRLQNAVTSSDRKLEALGGILRERFDQSEPDGEPAEYPGALP